MGAGAEINHRGCQGLVARNNLQGAPLGAAQVLRASVTLSMVAVAAVTLQSTLAPSSSPPAPLRALPVAS